MDDIRETVLKFIRSRKESVLPFMLSLVLSFAMFDIYENNAFLWWIPIIAVTLITFEVGEFVNKHHFVGSIALVVIIFVCFYAFFGLISGVDYGNTFQRWLLTGADDIDTRFEYLLALLISFVPFYAICIFYFTKVLYRMFFVTLISIIPCALYVKSLAEIDNFWLALTALLNVSIFLVHVRSAEDRNRKIVGGKTAVLSAVTFMFALLVVSAAIPKENDARYYDRFEELFMDTDLQTELRLDYTNFSEMSGNADNYRNFRNRRMYTVFGSIAPYFKRQCFDTYDYSLDSWYPFEDSNAITYTREKFRDRQQFLNLSLLQNAIRRADELSPDFSRQYGMSAVSKGIDVNDTMNTVIVTSENFRAMYLLSPARVVDIDAEDAYVTKSGVFRFMKDPHIADYSYKVSFYDEVISRRRFMELGGADISDADCELFLSDLVKVLSEGTEESDETLLRCAQSYLEVHREAMDYEKRCEENNSLIPQRIRDLAEEITAGAVYDRDKAAALASYFIREGYAYDLSYISADSSPEYFLFESRRGSCSDYASAFTLMARSVGLPERYCEGFAPELSSRPDQFIIKDSDSHAYAEVYIQNMGWMVFESTVPGDYNPNYGTDGSIGGPNLTLDTSLVSSVVRVMGVILGFVLIAVVCLPFFDEYFFMARMKKADPNDTVRMAYRRLSGGKASRVVGDPASMTAYEVTKGLSNATGADSTPLAFMLEKVSYGGGRLSPDEKESVMEVYERARLAINNYLSAKSRERRKKSSAPTGTRQAGPAPTR